jgi:16S rRNA (adenine1518-N6/adenine1519-N6)-dimethyltransferase
LSLVGVKPRKRFGQHFLSDRRILGRIADALQAVPGDRVLEIGPGRGSLTRVLLERDVRLAAIERDRDLARELAEAMPSLTVHEGDALELDWPQAAGVEAGQRWLVVGNIPYNLTSPLIEQALRPPRPARVVFLIQKEVADRLAALPGSKAYGGLTVGVAVVAQVERLFKVAPGAFWPPPKVDSAVIRITPRSDPLVRDSETVPFRQFVKGLFAGRRKQLGRALRTAIGDRDFASQLPAVDLTRRPETLSPAEFVDLFRRVVDG